MKTKFKSGDTVTIISNPEVGEQIVKAAKKDFRNGAISYRLESGKAVPEDDLKRVGKAPKKVASRSKSKKVKKNKADKKLITLREEYQRVFEKEVPSNKKNDGAWIAKAIADKKSEDEMKATDYEVLAKLQPEQLKTFIKEEGLDIDVEDYEDADLLKAVCEELSIAIPAKE